MDFVSAEWALGGIIGILCLFVLYFAFGKEHYPYSARRTLLTKTELSFYKHLRDICAHSFPDIGIAMQVRLGDIITCSEADWHKGYGPKISAKHIDFVLFNLHTTEVCLCIELDDSSHEKADRKRRDVFINNALKAAGVPLFRVPIKKMADRQFLHRNLTEFIL